jgi:hypothetical protein
VNANMKTPPRNTTVPAEAKVVKKPHRAEDTVA